MTAIVEPDADQGPVDAPEVAAWRRAYIIEALDGAVFQAGRRDPLPPAQR